MSNTASIEDLQDQLRTFAKARHWGPYHSPKNLTMALSVEVAELMEHFQWLTEEQSRTVSEDALAPIQDEVADVFLYLLQICNELDINLLDVSYAKLAKNAVKYPVL